MLLNVFLYFIVRLQFVEMRKCFCTSSQLVVNLELTTNGRKVLQRLQVWQVFSWVLHQISKSTELVINNKPFVTAAQ